MASYKSHYKPIRSLVFGKKDRFNEEQLETCKMNLGEVEKKVSGGNGDGGGGSGGGPFVCARYRLSEFNES